MNDGRINRKSKVVRFVSELENNRLNNFFTLIQKAKLFEMNGIDLQDWEKSVWIITGGRLLKQSGRSPISAKLNFIYSPKLGGMAISGDWGDLVKALVLLRFHRKQQGITNQRNFITAFGYIASEMEAHNMPICNLTPEYLNNACRRIHEHYELTVVYNMHKAIGEIAAHCDSNGICNILLDFKYLAMHRPESVGGLKQQRLDDPNTLDTKDDKLVDPKVFKIIGELYQHVPRNHKYRVYVLLLALLSLLGRRFSEIALLPRQELGRDEDGLAYLKYFPRKKSQGNVYTPIEKLYIPTASIEIIEPVVSELNETCSAARETASIMEINNGPDISLFANISESKRLYKEDLENISIPVKALDSTGWIRKNGFATTDAKKLSKSGRVTTHPSQFTNLNGVIAYCRKDFNPNSINPIHIDQLGKKYYLKDLLIVRYIGMSLGQGFMPWLATQCTHSMMTTFLRSFPDLATEYASSSIEVNFNSHHFRHTLNTLLDEGGLSDLLQTEWFGRSNARDTKAYQHTSREKRALQLREDIKAGKVFGRLVDKIMAIPVSIQNAVLAARVNAVHDVGPGICVHNFIQTSCSRHLQCSAECDDYVWVKEDGGRKEELKRLYAMTITARKTAERNAMSDKPKKSIDWIAHNDKKLKVLSKQMIDYKIEPFDTDSYLDKLSNE